MDLWICIVEWCGMSLLAPWRLTLKPWTLPTRCLQVFYHSGEIFKQTEKGEHVWKRGRAWKKETRWHCKTHCSLVGGNWMHFETTLTPIISQHKIDQRRGFTTSSSSGQTCLPARGRDSHLGQSMYHGFWMTLEQRTNFDWWVAITNRVPKPEHQFRKGFLSRHYPTENKYLTRMLVDSRR